MSPRPAPRVAWCPGKAGDGSLWFMRPHAIPPGRGPGRSESVPDAMEARTHNRVRVRAVRALWVALRDARRLARPGQRRALRSSVRSSTSAPLAPTRVGAARTDVRTWTNRGRSPDVAAACPAGNGRESERERERVSRLRLTGHRSRSLSRSLSSVRPDAALKLHRFRTVAALQPHRPGCCHKSVNVPGNRAISSCYRTVTWARGSGRGTFTAGQEYEIPEGGMPAE